MSNLQPIDSNPSDSFDHEILQARTLEWVTISFFRGSSLPRDRTHVSCVSCIAGGFFTTEPPGNTTAQYIEIDNRKRYTFLMKIHIFLSLDYFQRADEEVFLGKQKGVNPPKYHKISG